MNFGEEIMNNTTKSMKKYGLSAIIVSVFLISVFGIIATSTIATKPVNYSYAIVEFNENSIGANGNGHKLDLSSQAVYKGHLAGIHANFKAWMSSNAPWATAISDYYYTLDGVAVQYTGNNLQSLANGPDVKSITPDWLYKPTMDASVPLIQADQVWSAENVNPASTGAYANVKVGVIDSGISETNTFITSCRGAIQHDVFYSGDAGYNPANTIVVEHGTHVSGTIGGCYTTTPVTVGSKTIQLNGPISGVAPGVTLHDYNIFPGYGAGYVAFDGSAFSHDIANAVEKAVADGMDIISMSLGGTVQGPHDVLAEAVNNAVDSGVVAVVAAGNSGAGVPLSVESPGTAANAITVAASTNSHYFAGTKISLGSNSIYAVEGEFKTFVPPVTADYSTTIPSDGCSAISQITGKIAVIYRGTCAFSTKVNNAASAGAVGVIIINNVGGPAIQMAITGTQSSIPAVMVSQDDGVTLTNFIGTITVDSTTLYELSTIPDVMADFSSIGPTPFDFQTKPDVAAPGVNILSSVFNNKFDIYQGTSMATPHITGTAALLLANSPSLTPAQVKSAIVNNAERNSHMSDLSSDSVGYFYGPLSYGGGRVDALKAFDASVFASPSSLSFGGYTGGAPLSTRTTLTFDNSQNSAITVTLSKDNLGGNSNFVIDPKTGDLGNAPWDASSFVSFSSNSLTIQPHSSASVTVTFDSGKTLSSTGWSFGYVEASYGTTTMNIPWSIVFQQHSGALNGVAGSGFLYDSTPLQSTYPQYVNGLTI